MASIVEDEALFDPKRGLAGGYSMEAISLGLPFYVDQASGFRVIRRNLEWRLKTGAILFISEFWCDLYQKARPMSVRPASLLDQQPVSTCPEIATEPTANAGLSCIGNGFIGGTAPVRWICSDPLQLDVATGR
ncbi:MAG: hypothetical protein ABSD12_15705 [Paraburkholderia sp.]|jgi:hypothetical protein